MKKEKDDNQNDLDPLDLYAITTDADYSTETTTIEITTEQECVPGTSWKEDCTDCWCDKNGSASCERTLCSPWSNRRKTTLKPVETTTVKRLTEDQLNVRNFRCVPEEFFMVDCNYCNCSWNGMSVSCTMIRCGRRW